MTTSFGISGPGFGGKPFLEVKSSARSPFVTSGGGDGASISRPGAGSITYPGWMQLRSSCEMEKPFALALIKFPNSLTRSTETIQAVEAEAFDTCGQ